MFGLITVHALNVELLHLFGAVRSRWSVRADDTGPRGHHKLGFDQSGTYLKKNPSFLCVSCACLPFPPSLSRCPCSACSDLTPTGWGSSIWLGAGGGTGSQQSPLIYVPCGPLCQTHLQRSRSLIRFGSGLPAPLARITGPVSLGDNCRK